MPQLPQYMAALGCFFHSPEKLQGGWRGWCQLNVCIYKISYIHNVYLYTWCMFKYTYTRYIVYALSDGPAGWRYFRNISGSTPIRTNTTKVAPFGPRVDSYFNRILRMFLPVKNFNQMEVYLQDIPSRDPPCWVSHFSPPLSLSCCFWCFFWGAAQISEPWRLEVAIKLHVSTRALHQQSHRALGRRHGEMTREKSREKNTPKRQ